MLYYICTVIFVIFVWETSAAGDRTRAACTASTAGLQCSSDCTQLGYCDGFNWNAVLSCSDGQLCVNGACGNFESCPVNSINYHVICIDPSLKMPDLEDNTCQKYYTCTSTTTSEVGYGKHESCPTGQVFERCTGQCTTGIACNLINTEAECDPTAATTITIPLSTNSRLAYSCIVAEGGISTLWITCSDGYFIPNGGSSLCAHGLNYGCTNGGNDNNNNNNNNNGGVCATPGKYPVDGNTCVYLQCSSDGSSKQYRCATGYYFNPNTKACEVGTCRS